jgi:ribosomal protein S18 acetylase RimI-like enzyme
VADPLERIRAFVGDGRERRAERGESLPFGRALFVDSLPLVYYLNVVVVEPGARPSFEELVETVERVQGDAGLTHRKAVTEDEQLGRSLAPAFRALGWTAPRLLAMRWPGEAPAAAAAELVPRERLEPVWADEMRATGEAAGEEEIRQLIAARALTARTVETRYAASFAGAVVASSCELYAAGGTGQVENVVTQPAHRGRGHGTAVVHRALAESARLGNDLHFLLADDDDWPKEWYRRLGFEPVGVLYEFLKRPAPVTPGPAAA